MSIANDLQDVRKDVQTLKGQVESSQGGLARHDEQINGVRGLSAAITELAEEVQAMRRAMWTVGGGIVLSAVGFAITVLSVFGT